MAKLRVFVSSTFYDLRHIRSSLHNLIQGLGHEAILSEAGGVTYDPARPLDKSCYAEMATCDVVVLIIGGRYGSIVPNVTPIEISDAEIEESFSVTRMEHQRAIQERKVVYTFIEKSVYAEYRTFQLNTDRADVQYAHVDSTKVFHFIRDIEGLSENNAIFPFDEADAIGKWLKEQLSGLLQSLLRSRNDFNTLQSISQEIASLTQAGETLRNYLERILRSTNVDDAEEVIQAERRRVFEATKSSAINSRILQRMGHALHISAEDIFEILVECNTMNDFLTGLFNASDVHLGSMDSRYRSIFNDIALYKEVGAIRNLLGLSPFKYTVHRNTETGMETLLLEAVDIEAGDLVSGGSAFWNQVRSAKHPIESAGPEAQS